MNTRKRFFSLACVLLALASLSVALFCSKNGQEDSSLDSSAQSDSESSSLEDSLASSSLEESSTDGTDGESGDGVDESSDAADESADGSDDSSSTEPDPEPSEPTGSSLGVGAYRITTDGDGVWYTFTAAGTYTLSWTGENAYITVDEVEITSPYTFTVGSGGEVMIWVGVEDATSEEEYIVVISKVDE